MANIFIGYEAVFRRPVAYLASLVDLELSNSQLDALVLWSVFWVPVASGVVSSFSSRKMSELGIFAGTVCFPLFFIIGPKGGAAEYPELLGGAGSEAALRRLQQISDFREDEIEQMVAGFNRNDQLHGCILINRHNQFFNFIQRHSGDGYELRDGRIQKRLSDEIPF